MTLYFIFVLMCLDLVRAPPPLKLNIDCGVRDAGRAPSMFRQNSINLPSRKDVENLCSIIHNVLPKSATDGRFILIGAPNDQSGASNDFLPVTVPPPKEFVSKFKVPRIKIPKINVPNLRGTGLMTAPKIGASMIPFKPRNVYSEESSAERIEKFKKGVQKMMHIVKVLGKIDQYVSERTRSIVDILSRTLSDPTSP